MTDVYRTEGNPFASAIDEVRRATAARDVVREAAWQAGLAEARAALRDFGEAVAPALVCVREDTHIGPRALNIADARGRRVSICVTCSKGLCARRVIEVMWNDPTGRWLVFGSDEIPAAVERAALANILLWATRAADFGDTLAIVTPRLHEAIPEPASSSTSSLLAFVVAHPPALEPMPEPPWYARRVVHVAAGCASIVAVLLATC